jgi:hypothetical protein
MRLVLATITGGLVVAAAVAAPAAQATPVCASASTKGTVTGSRTVGPACAPYPYAVACQNSGAGVDPLATATVSVCYPLP